jgi:DNA helicase-2/ATP-dependent DNA helicase PcrA
MSLDLVSANPFDQFDLDESESPFLPPTPDYALDDDVFSEIEDHSSLGHAAVFDAEESRAKALTSLIEIQEAAVTHGIDPLLILAGAGTGKTKSLTSRIGFLVGSQRVQPHQVLAVTFTRKASQEMKHRLANMMGPVAKAMDVGTFHAISARLLRDNADRAGLEPNFSVLDADDQKNVVKDCYASLSYGEHIVPPDSTDSRRQVDYAFILDCIEAKKTGRGFPPNFNRGTFLTPHGIEQMYHRYERSKERMNAVDYNDILIKCRDLLRDDEAVRRYYQTLWRAVLVDEYQDTNDIQQEWLDLITDNGQGCYYTCVGDDDQSVYSFRGANIDNILSFGNRYPGARIIRLEQNFRSTRAILDAANHVIAGNESRHGKALFTKGTQGSPVLVHEFSEDRGEVSWIVDDIERKLRGGMRPSQIAIIARASMELNGFQPALTMRRIPFTVTAGRKYNQTAEIKTLSAYLRLMLNRSDNAAFEYAIDAKPRGFGKESLAKLSDTARITELPMIDILADQIHNGAIRKAAVEKVKAFIEFIDEIGDDYRLGVPLDQVIEKIIGECGIKEHIQELREKAENHVDKKKADQFRKQASSIEERVEQYLFHAKEQTNIQDFVDSMSLLETDSSVDDAVWLGTIHAAKGLEFDHVYLVGWEEGIFPVVRPDTDLEEERRLAYVAMTRAKLSLLISYAKSRFNRSNDGSERRPNVYINDIIEANLCTFKQFH